MGSALGSVLGLSMKLLRLIPWLPPGLLLILFGLGEAEELSNEKVFAGNLWDSGQKGFLPNLTIETKTLIDCVQTGEMHLQHILD